MRLAEIRTAFSGSHVLFLHEMALVLFPPTGETTAISFESSVSQSVYPQRPAILSPSALSLPQAAVEINFS